jgi:hypothetical protein
MKSEAAHTQEPPYLPSAETAERLKVFAFNFRMLSGLLAGFVIAGWCVLSQHGPWLDEFWSLWQSQHDMPLDEIVRQRWMADFNPPLFSFTHWVLTPFIGDSVLAHRFINFLGLGWAAAFVVVAVKRFPRREAFIIVFAALALSLPTTLFYLAEIRSYFAQMCVHFVLVTATVLIADSGADVDADLNWQTDRPFVTMLAASIVAAINLHYISALLACVLLAGLAVVCTLRGWRRWAMTIAGTTAVALVPLLWYMLAQLPFLLDSSKNYWVRGTIGHAALWIAYMGIEALGANVLASVLALLVIAATAGARVPTLRNLLRQRESLRFSAEFRRQLVLTAARQKIALVLLGVLATFCAALLLAHLRQPIVTARYLLNFQIVTLGLIAGLAAEPLMRRRLLLVLLVVSALLGFAIHGYRLAQEERWSASTRQVQALDRSCPRSPIYAVIVPRPTFSANEISVLKWAYQRQAQRGGMQIRYYEVGQGEPSLLAEKCPSLFWVEHVDWDSLRRDADVEEAMRFLGLNRAEIDRGRSEIYAYESGFVLSLSAR